MTEEIDSIKSTIKKLLNLANDPAAFNGEAENSLRLARKLMLKHNIKEDEIRIDPENTDRKTVYGSMDVFTFGRDMAKWEGVLLQTICKLVGTVQGYRNSNRQGKSVNEKTGKTHTRLTMYGPLSDVQDAVEIFEEWARIIVTLAKIKTGSWVREGGRSYCEGFVFSLWEKVTQIFKEEEAEISTGKSLVVRDAKAIMAQKIREGNAWLTTQKNVRLRAARTHTNRGDDPEMFHKGRQDGQNADFSRNIKPKLN